jgi:hypothetical protein
MTRLTLHIGMPHCGASRIQAVLAHNRSAMQNSGVLFPEIAGNQNHTRLFMAVIDPDHIEPFRWNRGRADPGAQAELAQMLKAKLAKEIEGNASRHVILSAWQLATLSNPSEIGRLHAFAKSLASEIEVVLLVDEQARVLVRHYTSQILDGRVEDLSVELDLAKKPDWHQSALALGMGGEPTQNAFPEIQTPPFWVDYARFLHFWTAEFGPKNIRLEPYDQAALYGPDTNQFVKDLFGLEPTLAPIDRATDTRLPSAQWLTRARQMNGLLHVVQSKGAVIPNRLRKRIMGRVATAGPEINPASLHEISARFGADNALLIAENPKLAQALAPDAPAENWKEPDPSNGFRASQYLTAFMPLIERNGQIQPAQSSNPVSKGSYSTTLPKTARENLDKLLPTRFAPHDNIGDHTADSGGAAFAIAPARELPSNNSGRVIVGCMKNEGPYILEWVAYHRAIGFDNFLIYTNDCTDHTDDILNRLQDLGVLQHRDNSKWKGNSPQQYALNQALKEDVIKNAEWIAHIDVDEFINIKVGNGTVDDLLARVPDATNIAMTWRLFGHGEVTDYQDKPVLAQFDQAAPRYCPKPHTVWGFKTMFRNIDAYAKISCHRPNKLRDTSKHDVQWVNGSGQVMKPDYHDRGWRSDVKSIGYDLVQLNHYALRSLDSFLIKRQRGRALHVDRSVGLNYWIRMDWNDHVDKSIQRNLDRMQQQYDNLIKDDKLTELHHAAVAWHTSKAAELRGMPEFADLRSQVVDIRLNSAERVAWSLALDMED